MLSIAVYSDQTDDIPQLKSIIQDFLIESKSMAKVSIFSNPDDFILSPYPLYTYHNDLEIK